MVECIRSTADRAGHLRATEPLGSGLFSAMPPPLLCLSPSALLRATLPPLQELSSKAGNDPLQSGRGHAHWDNGCQVALTGSNHNTMSHRNTILHSTRYNTSYNTIHHTMIQYNTIQHNMIQHTTKRFITPWYNTLQHTPRYNTPWYNTTHHNTTRYNTKVNTSWYKTTRFNTPQHDTPHHTTPRHDTTWHTTVKGPSEVLWIYYEY